MASDNDTVTLTRAQAEAILRDDYDARMVLRAQLAPKRAEPTPGPWKVVVGNRTICVSHSTRTILYCEQWCEGWDREFLDSEDMANARLIAAAPQFLEWAERLLKGVFDARMRDDLRAIVDSVYGGDDD